MTSLVTQENPNGYWCRPCGRSREYANTMCSSAACAERRRREDDLRARGFNSEQELVQHYRDTLSAYSTWPL